MVAGVRLRAPMMDIHTVAAGGGSICVFDGARYRVGPESAGADPGPGLLSPRRAAHRHRLQRDAGQAAAATSSRASSGRSGDEPLDARGRRAEIRRARRGDRRAPPATAARRSEVAEGFLNIAVENMANAIKQISIERGYDVTEYTLCCFGGAGGQHACLVADALGMTRVFIHPLAGVLSAYGMGLADLRALRSRRSRRGSPPTLMPRARGDARPARRGRRAPRCAAQGIAASAITVLRRRM